MQKTRIPIKPYSSKELSAMYGVSSKTFRKWIKLFEGQVGQKCGHFYMISQVEIIFSKLGIPDVVEE
jgi:transposase